MANSGIPWIDSIFDWAVIALVELAKFLEHHLRRDQRLAVLHSLAPVDPRLDLLGWINVASKPSASEACPC